MNRTLKPICSLATIPAWKQTCSVLSSVILLVASTASAQEPPAQNPASAPITADTGTVEEGRQAGKVAAGKRRMEGRLTAGYVGGLAISTLGTYVFVDKRLGVIGLGTGVAIIGTAWSLGDTQPLRTPSTSERGDAYSRAYSESYAKTLRSRRRKAVLLGGVVGIVGGTATRLLITALIAP